MYFTIIAFAFRFLQICMPAHGEIVPDFSIHRQYESVRALGMGNAFTASVNDYNAVLINPAALARLEGGEVNMAMEFAFDPTIGGFAGKFGDASKEKDQDKKTAAFMDALKSVYGTPIWGRANVFQGIWVRPNWGFAVLPMDVSIAAEAHNQVSPQLNLIAREDTSIVYGYGFDVGWIRKNRLSVGWNIKFVQRSYFGLALNTLDLIDDENILKNTNALEGATIDGDLGFLITPELPAYGIFSLLRLARPTFSLVVRNVLDWGWTDLNLVDKSKSEPPQKLHRVIDIGTKWEYPNLFIFGGRGVMDFRDILHPNINLRKSFHAGFEFDWRMTSWWRGNYRFGINQGYPTFGLSALFSIFNLDLATWGEEIGTFNTPKESRRYQIKLNINI